MSFFIHFGNRWHNLSKSQIYVNDITSAVTFAKKYRERPGVFLDYIIRDGDRPEAISYRVYGTRRFWWTILLFNMMDDMDRQWPMNADEFKSHLAEQYPGRLLEDTLYHLGSAGEVVDTKALSIVHGWPEDIVVQRFGLTPVSIFAAEQDANDARRKIKLIDPDIITSVEADIREAFR